jgi:3-methyladenine DNA glycosylase AlkD
MGTFREEIRMRLEALSEESYRDFQSRLLPGTERILGVRLPELRKLAREIAGRDYERYLEEMREILPEMETVSYEECMLEGLVIGYGNVPLEEFFFRLDGFIPKIRNWGICDSTAATCRYMQKYQEESFLYLRKYLNSGREFEIRFALVCLLDHFVLEEYLEQILAVCNEIHHEGYYVKMAMAWLVSVCYVKFPRETEVFLKKNEMDDFTQNKSIQKIRESFRVSKEDKERLLRWKRIEK